MTTPHTERHPFEARLGEWPDPRLAVVLRKRVAEQLKYFPAQIWMDQAHTVMLAEQGIISKDEARAILNVLADIEAGGTEGFPGDSVRSSMFWYVEASLIQHLGEHVGGKMHTGRSHNDIMPTVSRLTARERLHTLMAAVLGLQEVLVARACDHVETVMPGYTALQHSQPWTFGHYLIGWCYAFERDFTRLRHAHSTTNQSPLGASALAGTSWPLDRARTAALMGFDGFLPNSRDAGFATRDYVAEILAAIAIAMNDLNALCSDLYLWSTYEFGMVELPDGFSGTSSFMPQKKNAWAVDWSRAAAGSVVGNLASSLSAMRGTSSTDGGMQDYPEAHLPESFDLAIDYFELLAGTVADLIVNRDMMATRANANWSTASNLAETLARECDLSFRAAHGIVGRAVRTATERGLGPDGLRAADVDTAAVHVLGHGLGVAEEVVRQALDPVGFVHSRATAGSVNPDEVRAMVDDCRTRVAGARAELERVRAQTRNAHDRLREEVARLRDH